MTQAQKLKKKTNKKQTNKSRQYITVSGQSAFYMGEVYIEFRLGHQHIVEDFHGFPQFLQAPQLRHGLFSFQELPSSSPVPH